MIPLATFKEAETERTWGGGGREEGDAIESESLNFNFEAEI